MVSSPEMFVSLDLSFPAISGCVHFSSDLVSFLCVPHKNGSSQKCWKGQAGLPYLEARQSSPCGLQVPYWYLPVRPKGGSEKVAYNFRT